jgi:hypothetical protein
MTLPDQSTSVDRAVRQLPFAVGLCPDPDHHGWFYMPLDHEDVVKGNTICPECDKRMVIYMPRGFPDAS